MSRYFRLPEPGNRLYRLSEPSGEWSYQTAEGWKSVQFPAKAAEWLPEVPLEDLPPDLQTEAAVEDNPAQPEPFDFSVSTEEILDEMTQESKDFSAELLNAEFESEEAELAEHDGYGSSEGPEQPPEVGLAIDPDDEDNLASDDQYYMDGDYQSLVDASSDAWIAEQEAKRYRVWLQVPGGKGSWSEAARDVTKHQADVYETTCNYPVRIEEIEK